MRGQVMGDSPNVTQIDWPIQWVMSYMLNDNSAWVGSSGFTEVEKSVN